MKSKYLLSALACTSVACGLGQSRDATMKLDSNAVAAIDRMASARCERLQACGAPADAGCFEHLRTKTATDVRLSRCVSDVREPLLVDCVQAIKSEPCATPLDDVTRVGVCRVGALCEPGPEEGTI